MDFAHITFAVEEGVALLTLNRPDRLNAISAQMLTEVNAALDQVEDAGNGARCLLLTGAGRGFSSGADLGGGGMPMPGPGQAFDAGQVLEQYYNPLIERLADLPVPFITAVNGPAAGAGMSFAIAGDIVLAARSAYFLQAFVNIGLIPDAGSTYFLPRLVGAARARAMMMLGEKIPAETALRWGLVYDVVDDDALMPRARELARKLAQGPTRALRLIRHAAAASSENTLSRQLRLEREYQRQAGRTADFMEGVSAFLGKRPAKFTGA
ncbi:MAG: enoyl-CoA hydratase-related protein [Pseudomonadota bacterium]